MVLRKKYKYNKEKFTPSTKVLKNRLTEHRLLLKKKMVKKIQVIRKKSKSNKLKDPLVQQKLIWTIGHCMTLIAGTLFAISAITRVLQFYRYRSWKWLFLRVNKSYHFFPGNRWYHHLLRFTPQLMYRLSLIGVFLSIAVTSIQNWDGVVPTWYDLLASLNFQGGLIALMWFVAPRKSLYRILPFILLSFLHLLNRKNEFCDDPEVRKKKDEEFTVKYRYLLHTIVFSEIITMLSLFFDALLMQDGTAGVLLVIYGSLYWLRLNFSLYAQVNVLRILTVAEGKVPPKYRNKVELARRFVFVKMKEHEERLGRGIKSS